MKSWLGQNSWHQIYRITHLTDVPFDFLRFRVPHRIVESGQSDAKSVESVIRAVDCDHGGSRVGLGNSSVSLLDDKNGCELIWWHGGGVVRLPGYKGVMRSLPALVS